MDRGQSVASVGHPPGGRGRFRAGVVSSQAPLLVPSDAGFYCPEGDFHVDPWRHVLRARMGERSAIDAVEYGEAVEVNGVRVSLHPARDTG